MIIEVGKKFISIIFYYVSMNNFGKSLGEKEKSISKNED